MSPLFNSVDLILKKMQHTAPEYKHMPFTVVILHLVSDKENSADRKRNSTCVWCIVRGQTLPEN